MAYATEWWATTAHRSFEKFKQAEAAAKLSTVLRIEIDYPEDTEAGRAALDVAIRDVAYNVVNRRMDCPIYGTVWSQDREEIIGQFRIEHV